MSILVLGNLVKILTEYLFGQTILLTVISKYAQYVTENFLAH